MAPRCPALFLPLAVSLSVSDSILFFRGYTKVVSMHVFLTRKVTVVAFTSRLLKEKGVKGTFPGTYLCRLCQYT